MTRGGPALSGNVPVPIPAEPVTAWTFTASGPISAEAAILNGRVYVGTANGTLAYAKPDAADPTKPWIVHTISQPGLAYGHSLGVGDINGDGRPDVLQPAGW